MFFKLRASFLLAVLLFGSIASSVAQEFALDHANDQIRRLSYDQPVHDCTSDCDAYGCEHSVDPYHDNAGQYDDYQQQITCTHACESDQGCDCDDGDCPSVDYVSYDNTGRECNACLSSSCNNFCFDQQWYLALTGAWQVRESSYDPNAALTFFDWSEGFAINGAIGKHCGNWRFEAEVSLLNNGVDTLGIQTPLSASGTAIGNVSSRAFLLNLYYDFDGAWHCWRPYIGGGAGFYQSEINSLFADFFATNNLDPINATSDYALAYQMRIGATRPIGDRTDLHIGYRHFRGEEVEFAAAQIGTFRLDFAKSHNVEIGLQIRF